jgi:hypothetical protein
MRACRTALIAALLAIAWTAQSFAATYVQGKNTAAFSGTSVSISLPSAVTAGDTLIFQMNIQPSTMTVSSVTRTGDTPAVSGATTTGLSSLTAGGIDSNTTGSSAALVVNLSGGPCTNCSVFVEEWSGLCTTSSAACLDGSSVNTSGSSSSTINYCASTPCYTTTANGDFIWGGFYQGQNVAPTAGSGFTLNSTHTIAVNWWSESMTQASFGTTTPTITTGASSFNNYLFSVAIKATASAPSPNPARSLFVHPGPF